MAIEGSQSPIDAQSCRGSLLDGGLFAVSGFRRLPLGVGLDQGDGLRLHTFVPRGKSIATVKQLRAGTTLRARVSGLGVRFEICYGLIRLVLAQTRKC